MGSDLTENLPCVDSWTLTGHTAPLDPHVQVCPYSNWRVDLVGHKVVRHRSYGHYHMRILMLGVSLWGRGGWGPILLVVGQVVGMHCVRGSRVGHCRIALQNRAPRGRGLIIAERIRISIVLWRALRWEVMLGIVLLIVMIWDTG